MTLDEYTESCERFSDETKQWWGLDNKLHYVALDGDWRESTDNAEGGVHLDWAFHKTKDEIKKTAPHEFYYEFKLQAEQAVDEDFDEKQYQNLLRRFI